MIGKYLMERTFDRMEIFFLLVFIYMVGFSHQVPPDIDSDSLARSAKFVPDLGHKLQVAPLKTLNVKDLFECTLECLGHDGCLSINIAKNVVGGLRVCQLLAIDKKDSPTDLVVSADFHYYDSGVGLPKHCADAKKRNASAQSGNYRVKLPNREVEVYCDMQNFGGGWTLVVSISASNKNHVQRKEVNCQGDLCVPYTNINVPSRKFADVDIHHFASEEGTFRLEVLTAAPFSVFYKIPSGAQYFDTACAGTPSRCPRIIISHHHPYQWEYSCAGAIGYHISASGWHHVFDGHDDGECSFYSSLYQTQRALYNYSPNNGIYPDRQGLMYVK